MQTAIKWRSKKCRKKNIIFAFISIYLLNSRLGIREGFRYFLYNCKSIVNLITIYLIRLKLVFETFSEI